MLFTALANEIDCFSCLKNLVSQVVSQEGRDHHIVELVLLRPEFLITHVRVRLDKELLEWVIDLASHHPSLDHR